MRTWVIRRCSAPPWTAAATVLAMVTNGTSMDTSTTGKPMASASSVIDRESGGERRSCETARAVTPPSAILRM